MRAVIEFAQSYGYPIVALSYYLFIKYKYMFKNGKAKDKKLDGQ